MRYIAINPQKARKFVTKGVNLSLRNPVALIPPGLEGEFMAKIIDGLKSKEIFEISDSDIIVSEQAKIDAVNDEEQAIGTIGTIKSLPNKEGKSKILQHTITMPPADDDDDNDNNDDEIKEIHNTGIILTDIIEEYDENE